MDIKKQDVSDGVEILFNTPQLKNLSTCDNFKEIFTDAIYDNYTTSNELQNYFRYHVNEKMINTIYRNYGIAPEYYKKLNPIISRTLIYYLETLFQTKGSQDAFKIFAELLNGFYEEINFYNIGVNKLNTGAGKYNIAYILNPILLGDAKRQYFPKTDINLQGKYLMDITQYSKYTFFPIDTNLIYIQFVDSTSKANSDKYFFTGLQAYSYTKKQEDIIKIYLPSYDLNFDLNFLDLELIITYINYRIIQTGDDERQKNFDLVSTVQFNTSSLRFHPDDLESVEDLLFEYQTLDNFNRKDLANFRRRWEYLLNKNKLYHDNFGKFDDIEKTIIEKYPDIKKILDNIHIGIDPLKTDEELLLEMKEDYLNIFLELYVDILQKIDSQDEFLNVYINILFQSNINGNIFIKNFFEPIFKLFITYFFPANMDYSKQLSDSFFIRDKFNSIATEELVKIKTNVTFLDLHPMPISQRKIKIKTREINKIFSERNRKEQMPVDVLIKESNLVTTQERIDPERIKGDFFKSQFPLRDYIWKKTRLAGYVENTVNAFIGFNDYDYLKKDMYFDINTYLFYKNYGKYGN